MIRSLNKTSKCHRDGSESLQIIVQTVTGTKPTSWPGSWHSSAFCAHREETVPLLAFFKEVWTFITTATTDASRRSGQNQQDKRKCVWSHLWCEPVGCLLRLVDWLEKHKLCWHQYSTDRTQALPAGQKHALKNIYRLCLRIHKSSAGRRSGSAAALRRGQRQSDQNNHDAVLP